MFVGNTLLPDVLSTIEQLRKLGKQIMFATNTSTQTRLDCQRRLESMGVTAAVKSLRLLT
ncbi:hypothetical protein [Ferviditalea candida]|uniref:hypothetical protein n=1 Tax=Ferviditalea candida TaxID=3108399 RepID=UPI00352E317B